MDLGLLEAAVSEADPASAEGRQWVGVPEVEGRMVLAWVAVMEGDSAEVPDFNQKSQIEGKGGGT